MKRDEKETKNSFTGKGVFPPRYAFTLLIPLRNFFLSPKKLIKRLELKRDHRVLEIGPGPGYFSPAIARTLSNGRLVLTDIQQEMIEFAKKRLEKRNIQNVDYDLCNGRTFNFADGEFDRVVMVTVIGEVENQDAYIQEIHRILKNDGILSISEMAGDPDKLSMEELQSLVCNGGFKVKRIYGSKRNYTINFIKNETVLDE